MEFHEKLQELRKRRELTQEELAQELYVSRTAISKWESGRGYPSIESLKAISRYFSVTVDDLLSGEKVLSIAEKENKANIRNLCDWLLGVADVFSLSLIILPFYPQTVDGYVYSVNLWMYMETSASNRLTYWILFSALVLSGALKMLFMQLKKDNEAKRLTGCSMGLSIAGVLFLALAREAYAAAVCFALLVIKGLLLFRYIKAGG